MENFNSTIDKNAIIGVLCGGLSSEREVSLRSGNNCYDALCRLGYKNVEKIDVQKDVACHLLEKNIDIAFLALHGTYGEDGCIQGMLELMGVSYTGSGVLASAIAMNKGLSKDIAGSNNIPVLPSLKILREELKDIDKVLKRLERCALDYPVMLKPMSEGSSIGMMKLDREEELPDALRNAAEHRDGVLLETFIIAKSVTVGVLDVCEETVATPILELRSKNGGWYDYEAKYTEGLTEFVLPAELDNYTTIKTQSYAKKIHKLIGCRGMSRVDFMVTRDGTPYFLEINTLPGMTNLSDLPAQAKAMGITYDTLVDIILHSALQ